MGAAQPLASTKAHQQAFLNPTKNPTKHSTSDRIDRRDGSLAIGAPQLRQNAAPAGQARSASRFKSAAYVSNAGPKSGSEPAIMGSMRPV